MKSLLLAAVALLTCPLLLFSQGSTAPKYSNEFLAIGVGAEALGMSNSVVAQTRGVYAGYWNPAGLTATNKWADVGLMHSEYFAGIAKYDYIGVAHQIDEKSAAGLSVIRFAVDDIPNTTQLIDQEGNIDYDRITTFTAADYAFIFSYARKLNIKGISVGGNFKVIHRKVGDFAGSWGFGLDAGMTYDRGGKWKLGAVVRDLTSTFNAWVFHLDETTKQVYELTGNEIPKNGLELTLPRIILAANYKTNIGKKFNFSSELDTDITTDGKRNTVIKSGLFSVDPHIGVAFGFKDIVFLRGGVGNLQYIKNFDDSKQLTFQPNIGIGIRIKSVYLDYAFTDIGDQSTALYSHVISLRVLLNRPANMQPKKS